MCEIRKMSIRKRKKKTHRQRKREREVIIHIELEPSTMAKVELYARQQGISVENAIRKGLKKMMKLSNEELLQLHEQYTKEHEND